MHSSQFHHITQLARIPDVVGPTRSTVGRQTSLHIMVWKLTHKSRDDVVYVDRGAVLIHCVETEGQCHPHASLNLYQGCNKCGFKKKTETQDDLHDRSSTVVWRLCNMHVIVYCGKVAPARYPRGRLHTALQLDLASS